MTKLAIGDRVFCEPKQPTNVQCVIGRITAIEEDGYLKVLDDDPAFPSMRWSTTYKEMLGNGRTIYTVSPYRYNIERL